MKIAVIGGGPGGLYFSALAKQLDPHHEITVWERNAPDDTFGFGVVFSDETLGGIEHADQAVYAAMQREFARWDDIDVHYRGEVFTSGGHGFAAMSRKRLLEILQQRCRDLGVTMHFRTDAPDVEELVAHPRPRAGRRRGQLRGPPALRRTPSAPPSTCGSASTCGWARPRCSTPSTSTSSRRRTASCRCTATRSTTRARPSSSRCTRTSGAQRDSTPSQTASGARATPTRSPSRRSRRSAPTFSTATR